MAYIKKAVIAMDQKGFIMLLRVGRASFSYNWILITEDTMMEQTIVHVLVVVCEVV